MTHIDGVTINSLSFFFFFIFSFAILPLFIPSAVFFLIILILSICNNIVLGISKDDNAKDC